MRRPTLLLVFAVVLGVWCWSDRSSAQVSRSRITRIADGVWFRLGDRDQGHCNNVIIELGDSLFVVDANFPSGAEALLRDLESVSDKPVTRVFDTHHHGDHMYGNPVWTRAGATTLAFAAVAEEISRYEPQRWREAVEERSDVAALDLDAPEPPRETFSRSPHVIEEGGRRIELHHFGWAHTRGDGFVFLPQQKILCTGDAAVNGPHNYTGDGFTGNWPDVIRKAEALGAEVVLPGHGDHGGPEILAGQRAFFEEINAKVGAAFEAGRPLSDLVTIEDDTAVATSVTLSPAVQNWVGESLPEQVRRRYRELELDKPHGEILGGS